MNIRVRRLRHRSYTRLRHSEQFRTWIDTQAKRLKIPPLALYNDYLRAGMSAAQVEAIPTPEPEV